MVHAMLVYVALALGKLKTKNPRNVEHGLRIISARILVLYPRGMKIIITIIFFNCLASTTNWTGQP